MGDGDDAGKIGAIEGISVASRAALTLTLPPAVSPNADNIALATITLLAVRSRTPPVPEALSTLIVPCTLACLARIRTLLSRILERSIVPSGPFTNACALMMPVGPWLNRPVVLRDTCPPMPSTRILPSLVTLRLAVTLIAPPRGPLALMVPVFVTSSAMMPTWPPLPVAVLSPEVAVFKLASILPELSTTLALSLTEPPSVLVPLALIFPLF